jgi:5-methyltetrahydropteroyltriglutamate--homocysteine methyltransferase
MADGQNRILTTHVGSLIRPPELVAMLKGRDAGLAIDGGAFEKCLKRSVDEIVRRQAATGIDILNDGEFGKTISWSRYILERMTGFTQRDRKPGDTRFAASTYGKDRRDFAEFYQEYDPKQGFVGMVGWVVDGPIRYQGHAALQRDIADLKAASAGVEKIDTFMAAVAPASVLPERTDEHYKSDEDYLGAVADALHEEYKAIVDAGLILQIDDAFLASMYDLIVPPGTMADYRRWAEPRIEALNHALRGIPPERTRYHVCWGSWNGPHVSDVPLRDIVDLVLRVNVGGYAIEMANPRHEHEWRVWETVKLPDGKYLIPGVLSHSTNVVEHPELVADRLTRLARLVGRDRVMAGTDCGFAQGPFVQRVHPSIMWAKLEAMVEGARLASRELWGQ